MALELERPGAWRRAFAAEIAAMARPCSAVFGARRWWRRSASSQMRDGVDTPTISEPTVPYLAMLKELGAAAKYSVYSPAIQLKADGHWRAAAGVSREAIYPAVRRSAAQHAPSIIVEESWTSRLLA